MSEPGPEGQGSSGSQGGHRSPEGRKGAGGAAGPGPASDERASLQLESVGRCFRQGGSEVRVLEEVSLSVHPGELVALVGASGSGKTTLLQLAGLLDRPDGGRILLAGRDAAQASERERTLLRRAKLGFVYQHHRLLGDFTALENLLVPLRLNGMRLPLARRRAAELLEAVGLRARMHHRPAALSGGEQQRVALARAIVHKPALILADEPTGNLDPAAAEAAFAILQAMVRGSGTAALVATHNLELAAKMDRTLRLHEGRIKQG